MRYAVIAPDEDYHKKYIWQRRKPTIKWLSYENGAGCDVIMLPYRTDEIDKMGDRRLRRLARTIRKMLGDDIAYVFFPAHGRLRGALEEEGLREPEGSDVFLDVADVVVRKCVKNYGWNVQDVEIGVYDGEMTNKSIELIRTLSERYGHLSLFTRDVDVANGYMEEIYEESGMPVRVSDDFSGYLPRMQVVIALGEITEGRIARGSVVLDVFGENAGKEFRTVSRVKFMLSKEERTLQEISGREPELPMIDFMILTGAKVVVPQTVQVAGYA